MVFAVKKVQPQIYTAPKNDIFPEVHVQSNPMKKDGSKKLALGLTGLAVLGTAAIVMCMKKKPEFDLKNISAIKAQRYAVAQRAVNDSGSRGARAVQLYEREMNHKKLDVLRYKISHGMMLDKPDEVMEHILRNKRNLELAITKSI